MPLLLQPVGLERPKGELTAAEWARVFAEAAALGVVQLHISGGEPLARRDVADIVRGARGAGLYVNLITAAVGLTPSAADALVEAGVEHVQISLQDATREGCNRITNYAAAFEKKLERRSSSPSAACRSPSTPSCTARTSTSSRR